MKIPRAIPVHKDALRFPERTFNIPENNAKHIVPVLVIFTLVYIDYTLVCSKLDEDRITHLDQV